MLRSDSCLLCNFCFNLNPKLIFHVSTLEEIAEALGDKFEEGDPDEQVELFLEFVILTVPVEVEEVDYRVANTIRSSSMCSLSPIPIGKKGDLGLILCSRDKDISFSG